jgi:hypothetical protein
MMHKLSMYGHWGYASERSISIRYTYGPLLTVECCRAGSYLVSPGKWGPVPILDLLHPRSGTLEGNFLEAMKKEDA